MNAAIIVAAGRGTRFGSAKPKQFLEFAGKPVVIHTLQRFEDCSSVDEIILVLSESEIANFLEIATNFKLSKLKTVAAGGETRAQSVWNGLKSVSTTIKIVAVHDGARPLVTSAEIAQTIDKAEETGAAVLVAPVTDTIKEVSADQKILRTIDRENLRRALTPQCFQLEILRQAFTNINILDSKATDESFLVEQLGANVMTVEGSARNIKITVPEDLILAEALLNQIDNYNV